MIASVPLVPHSSPASEPATPLIVEAQQAPSALLARLIQEVQHEGQATVTAYNRTHNRHNRGR